MLMGLTQTTIAGVFALNLLVGIGLVLGVYRLMEHHVSLGALGGTALGGVVILAESRVGRHLWDLTIPEIETLVVAAALGAVLGIVATVLTIRPSIEGVAT
jgi:hypothetical protein